MAGDAMSAVCGSDSFPECTIKSIIPAQAGWVVQYAIPGTNNVECRAPLCFALVQYRVSSTSDYYQIVTAIGAEGYPVILDDNFHGIAWYGDDARMVVQ